MAPFLPELLERLRKWHALRHVLAETIVRRAARLGEDRGCSLIHGSLCVSVGHRRDGRRRCCACLGPEAWLHVERRPHHRSASLANTRTAQRAALAACRFFRASLATPGINDQGGCPLTSRRKPPCRGVCRRWIYAVNGTLRLGGGCLTAVPTQSADQDAHSAAHSANTHLRLGSAHAAPRPVGSVAWRCSSCGRRPGFTALGFFLALPLSLPLARSPMTISYLAPCTGRQFSTGPDGHTRQPRAIAADGSHCSDSMPKPLRPPLTIAPIRQAAPAVRRALSTS
jgi:hypothetical protein